MKIALACSGIGFVKRGYESSVLELYAALKDKVPVTLYRGGAGDLGQRCPTIPCNSPVYTHFPFNRIGDYRRYAAQCELFAAGLAIRLFQQPSAVVFTPDHVVAEWVTRWRRWLPGTPPVIFSNGAPFANEYCARFQFVHQKSYEHFKPDQAPHTKMFFIPNGFDPKRLAPPADFDVAAGRRRWNLPADKTIVLCLSALNSHHKRVDWIIDELAPLRNSCFLLACGQDCGETATLRARAETLGLSAKFMTAPYEQVPELIWSSDLMVLGSLWEGFPRVVAEAMGARKMIFVHPHQNGREILGGDNLGLVDMSAHGCLADAIRRWLQSPKQFQSGVARNYERFLGNFSWPAVADRYLAMFETVARLNA